MENPRSQLHYKQRKIMIRWLSDIINALSDDDLKMSIAPGKNHGVWILGHLVQSEDELSTFLGKGEMIYPHYNDLFGQKSKLKPAEQYPPVSELREQWEIVK